MYATCLFCNTSLGANEAIEQFPVGRRLAYDAAAGRLWVVCQSCARWNLSPLETRWEAIEEAERQFRGAKMRASTDNIGLTRLKEGTELVRVGKPLKSEFAAWRYGDQFAKRHRKTWIQVGGSLVLVAGSVGFTIGSMLGLKSGTLGISALGAGIALNFSNSMLGVLNAWKVSKKISTVVRDENGELVPLTAANAREVALIPAGSASDWKLKVPRNRVKPAGALTRLLGQRESVSYNNDRAFLNGDVALRALATLLPSVNRAGASKKSVNEATQVIDDLPDVQSLLRKASTTRPGWKRDYMDAGESVLGQLPPNLLLALEMSLHSEDERRAMEGELKELEQRWRDADAIAKIADNLLVSDAVNERIKSLRD